MFQLIRQFVPEAIIDKIKYFKKRDLYKTYKGDAVFCPICHSSFKEFLPYGTTQRANAQCLTCGSLERHRLMYLYINSQNELFNTKEKIRVLHIAPEKVFYDLFLKLKNIDYVPVDLYPETYNYYGKVKVKKADVTHLPFEDNNFDVILCSHVLEHIPDDRLAMSEIFRVLKKGAWSILQVPIDYNRATTYEDFTKVTPEERLEAFGQKDHVRWYGKDYKDRLKSAQFKVKEDDFVKHFSKENLWKYGLINEELIYYCEKE